MSKSTHYNVYFDLSPSGYFRVNLSNNFKLKSYYEDTGFHSLLIDRQNTSNLTIHLKSKKI